MGGEDRATPGGEEESTTAGTNNGGLGGEDSNNISNSMFRSSSSLGGGLSDLAGLGLGSSSKTNDMLVMSGLGRIGLEELAGYSDLMSGHNNDDFGFEDSNGGGGGLSGNGVTHAQIAARLGLTSVGLGGANNGFNNPMNGSSSNSLMNGSQGVDLGLGLALNIPNGSSSSSSNGANNPLNGVSNSLINENPSSLLGLDTGMGDSSYMRGSTTNSKTNPIGGGAGATGHIVSNPNSSGGGPSLKRKGEVDDDGNNINSTGAVKNPKSTLLTALGGSAGPGMGVITHGMGAGIPAVRWDVGKSLTGLTTAKDFEVEGDLVNMRKVGGKRRRRG